MGKEKINIGSRIPSVTKEGMKNDNVRLTRDLEDVRKQYQDVYNVVRRLDDEYQRSKANIMSTRYSQLKRMIKNATTDDVLEKSLPPSEQDQKKKKSAISGLLKHSKDFAGESSSSHHSSGSSKQSSGATKARQPSGKSTNLLQACKQFAGAADEAYPNKDLDDMSKKEVSADNKEKKHHIVKYDTKFLRLHNRLEKLKRDYEDSKEHQFPQRYALMKEMIKTVIKDDTIKPD